MMRILGMAFVAALLGTLSVQAQPVPPPPPLASNLPQCNGHVARISPIVATHVSPPYPTISQRLGEQGTSLLRVTLNPDGSVAADALTRSSGSERLDQAALDFVKANWRWAPI